MPPKYDGMEPITTCADCGHKREDHVFLSGFKGCWGCYREGRKNHCNGFYFKIGGGDGS